MDKVSAEALTEAAQLNVESIRRIGVVGYREKVHVALGLASFEEWAGRTFAGIKLAKNERQEIEQEMVAEGATQREIAALTGVSLGTVNGDLQAGKEPVFKTEQDDPEAVGDHGAGEEPVFKTEHGQDEPEAHPQSVQEPVEDSKGAVHSPVVNEGDEWYTPRWLFDALGVKFDLDVCAPLNPIYASVPALRGFTIEDDGLSQPWEGTVWCNPPYSKPEPWARRMIHHKDGLLLTHIPMNAGWCVDLWETCDAIRLFQAMEFVRPDGTSQRPGYWLQLAAFGETATQALARLQPLGSAASNKRRIASPMWGRVA